jgi:hypothetical protein
MGHSSVVETKRATSGPHHEKPMTTQKKTKKSHAATARHITNEGDQTMKTTKKTHATNASHTSHATDEGETTMKTTKTMHASLAPTATTEAASATAAAETPNATQVAAATPSPSPTTLAYIQTCTTLLEQLEAAFPNEATLTARDKKHKPKARKGSERFTPKLVGLAQQHGVNLRSIRLDAISNASAEAEALVPLQLRIESLAARGASRMFTLQSTSWSGSAKLYSVLKRLSKDDGDIATGLAPVEQFFNHRHPSVAKDHPKTKKGKAALAAEKAAQAAAAAAAPVVAATAAPVTAAVTAAAATPVTTPAIAATEVTHS